MRDVGDAGDRGEILHRIVGAVLQQALVGGVGLVGAENERVAVGLGVRHRDAADHAGAAAAIVHRDRLAETASDRLRDQPRRDIDRSAGRVGHDDGDGAARKRLRAGVRAWRRARPAPQCRPPRQHGVTLSAAAANTAICPSSAASKALAIASLLLPGFAASPITMTIWPGSRQPREARAGGACARDSRTSRAPSATSSAATAPASARRRDRAAPSPAARGRSDSARRSRSRCGRTAPAGRASRVTSVPIAEGDALALRRPPPCRRCSARRLCRVGLDLLEHRRQPGVAERAAGARRPSRTP